MTGFSFSIVPIRFLTVFALMLLTVSSALAEKSIKVPLADGFDFPVGKPDGAGYYVYRGYYPNGHLGEDWNGNGGGNTDLGDPVYSTADGVVVFSEDYLRGWGNVVIIRHAYLDENGRVALVDSLYGHLDRRMVRKYQIVKRGQMIGTIGTAHGRYAAHLHFEMRKNIHIGMARQAFARDYSNYFSPRVFISARRKLRAGANVMVPVDTFKVPGADAGPDQNVASAGDAKRNIPTRQDAAARKTSGEASKATREAQLQRLLEENRRKVEAMKAEDMDAFWERLRRDLDDKKKR